MPSTPLHTLIHKRLARREVLRGGLKAATVMASGSLLGGLSGCAAGGVSSHGEPELNFQEIPKSRSVTHHIAPGHRVDVVARWGDSICPSETAPFAPHALTAVSQTQRIGQNCDYTAFLPLPKGSDNSNHGLLHINHEYTISELMFTATGNIPQAELTRQVEVEQAAQGFSVVEIQRTAQGWAMVNPSTHARRVTATDKIALSGPAAGHPRMINTMCPHGKHAKGTFGNCAGGVTPWHTVLSCEENIDTYFVNLKKDNPEYRNHRRMRIGEEPEYRWHKVDPRFDVSKHPTEPNGYGWVVEYDPYDRHSTPVKRTALGRFKHESATVTLDARGHVVVYSGDDEIYQYLYRFVSAKAYDPANPQSWGCLLDEGTLSVARFHEDGSALWIPLVWGQHGLDAAHGFHSQADVLIETRLAADIVGATPLDRPEDIEIHPHTGKVYVALTKNKARKKDGVDKANPRGPNPYGHILELSPHGGDHGHACFGWDIFLQGGDPAMAKDAALYHPQTSEHGWLTNPDNLAFDPLGRLWIGTDGLPDIKRYNDGLFATCTQGQQRGLTRLFFTAPTGAEITGPSFTPDGRTLFLSIQHPGDDENFEVSAAKPMTRWPDFDPTLPPRSAVIAITKEDGGVLGS